MRLLRRREEGQTMVEFGIFCSVLLMLTLGLVDLGRGFYQYNAISAAARYGARFGAVMLGTCSFTSRSGSFTDSSWCSQESTVTGETWTQTGNAPQQAYNYACPDAGGSQGCCPNSGNVAGFPYYTVSSFGGQNQTTIVGAIFHHFDTTPSNDGLLVGGLTPGFDLTKLKVCIQLPVNKDTNKYEAAPGDTITVKVYYRFNPVSALITNGSLDMEASSTYVIE